MGANEKNKSNSNEIKNKNISNGNVDSSKMKDPFAVTWSEKYNGKIENVWSKLPKFISTLLVTIAICTMGLAISGDWLNILVHLTKQFDIHLPHSFNNTSSGSDILKTLKLTNLGSFWLGSIIFSYAIYFSIGGFLHWYFYVRQRDRSEEWKCQPNKWMSPELEKHEIIFGSLSLLVNATTSAIIACYVSNGGHSTIYYDFSEYPIWWLILQVPVVFIYQDYAIYWLHRIYHTPFLYKNFHKLHHKYKQPTAWSVTAIHPVESTHIQLTMIIPIFLIPVHWASFYACTLYIYYHGIIDHSGINFKAFWWQPWQPGAIFHDNHHQYFHVNFAFNIYFWDILHGTYRRKDRLYTEDIFYGRGKALTEASEAEIKADLKERKSENPLAYRGNKLKFDLNENELKAELNGMYKKLKNKNKTYFSN